MIDEKKLLQWIEDKKYVFAAGPGDFDDYEDYVKCQGSLKVLGMIERDIELGEFVVDNGEEVKG
jgi:hypothetical protein